MTKDEAILRFFQSLRLMFKTAVMYKLDHPAFIHCVEDLKGRAEDVFTFVSPLSVGFTPRSLFADGRFWEGEKTFRELGMLFHLRKIKSGAAFDIAYTLIENTFRGSTSIQLNIKDIKIENR